VDYPNPSLLRIAKAPYGHSLRYIIGISGSMRGVYGTSMHH